MRLTADHMATYYRDGFLVVPDLFSPSEVQQLGRAYQVDCQAPGDHRVLEAGSDGIRAVYGSHLRQPVFAALVRDPRLLGPAQQLHGPQLYVYQFKINAKPAFGGESWSWHQDYVAWQLADQLPSPRLINVAVFLDDVDEFNGPVIFLRGSHRQGSMLAAGQAEQAPKSRQHLDPEDISIGLDQLADLTQQCPMVSPKGAAGTVVFFHPEIVHGSATNMSAHERRLLILTYNEVDNEPRPTGTPRPEYLVCRDRTPLSYDSDSWSLERFATSSGSSA